MAIRWNGNRFLYYLKTSSKTASNLFAKNWNIHATMWMFECLNLTKYTRSFINRCGEHERGLKLPPSSNISRFTRPLTVRKELFPEMSLLKSHNFERNGSLLLLLKITRTYQQNGVGGSARVMYFQSIKARKKFQIFNPGKQEWNFNREKNEDVLMERTCYVTC